MAFRPRRRVNGSGDDQAGAPASEVDTVLRVLAQYPPGARLTFGAPARCPVCGDFGLVDVVDERRGASRHRCLRCATTWMITRRALRSAVPLLERSGGLVEPRLPRAPLPALTPAVDERVDTAPRPTGVLFSRDADGGVDRRLLPADAGLGLPAAASSAYAAAHPAPRSGARAPSSTDPMRILLVEDDLDDIDVVKAILEPVAGVIDLRTARTRAAGEEAARKAAPDLVLLDLGLPDSHGMATVTRWHFNVTDTPIVVVSGGYGSDVADRGRELGVSGFVDKSELADLLAAGDAGATAFLDRLTAAASA